MEKINYQKRFESVISKLEGNGVKPRLLLHSCCAPCSSYCLVYLREWFEITCLYYNPNITDRTEYDKRIDELFRLADELNNDPISVGKCEDGQMGIILNDRSYLDSVGRIDVIEVEYDRDLFFELVRKGNLANEPEGGLRCRECFDLRVGMTAQMAKDYNYDFFTTTLTISPLKNSELLNIIGYEYEQKIEGKALWLPSDFKKKNGYKMSVELSARYDMYRQNYCGCIFSQKEMENKGVNNENIT